MNAPRPPEPTGPNPAISERRGAVARDDGWRGWPTRFRLFGRRRTS